MIHASKHFLPSYISFLICIRLFQLHAALLRVLRHTFQVLYHTFLGTIIALEMHGVQTKIYEGEKTIAEGEWVGLFGWNVMAVPPWRLLLGGITCEA